ncbi:MAG: ABC transporter ATP-binding protein [Bacilli bacterium]|nr:ABC transporter ATP-binding protein [Bacilli bacterium]
MYAMKIENIDKIYLTASEKVVALADFSYEFEKGKFYAVMGHSGSGKSTLIKILGLMDNLTGGKYILDGKDVSLLDDEELSNIRMKKIGFVFQDYYLDKNLRAYENVILPMLINKNIDKTNRKNKACDLLKMLGLEERINHYPRQLSGGEQQRVCIARALANNPDYILGDEPTGNLDEDNEKKILCFLKSLSRQGKCVIVVSHSNAIKKYADKIIFLKGGKLVLKNENE